MTQPAPEHDEYEAWRDLQDVLEEREPEWWAGQGIDDAPPRTDTVTPEDT